jgi:uncharacterized protein
MDPRAAHLIKTIGLRPHPEGGYFSEVYRSAARVQPLDHRSVRSALTTIYFLLVAGQVSRWHQVASDEVWHHYEGDPLELWVADASFVHVAQRVLGRVGEGMQPTHVVLAHDWQAARSTGAYTLVGCTVGPGFEFADFQMIDKHPEKARIVRARHPDLVHFL